MTVRSGNRRVAAFTGDPRGNAAHGRADGPHPGANAAYSRTGGQHRRAGRRKPYDSGKRLLDIAVAVLAGLVSLPVTLIVAAVVAVTLGRPVLFRQVRPGRHGVPFQLVKFRTMRLPDPARPGDGDEARLTRVGNWLRAASLDELPTLWNVLRGEMSMVGPRPLLMEYLPRYTPEQARRHEVRPGITGLAQVSGRNALSWAEKFACDVWYVEHRCFRLDLRILLGTVRVVLRRDGVIPPGDPAAPEFLGTTPAVGSTADSCAAVLTGPAPGPPR